MGGYKRSRTVKLVWADDHELAGLEVRARRVSIEALLELSPVLEMDLGGLSAEDLRQMRDMFCEFGRLLVSWNLVDEYDVPVPCTPEEFVAQDLAFINEIITAWAEHIAGVAAPLGKRSSSGDPSLEASLPMDVSSGSLPS